MVDEILFRAVRADVAFEREVARDDLFDGDFLVPAVAAVLLLAPRLGDLFGAAQRASRLDDRLAGHESECIAPSCRMQNAERVRSRHSFFI